METTFRRDTTFRLLLLWAVLFCCLIARGSASDPFELNPNYRPRSSKIIMPPPAGNSSPFYQGQDDDDPPFLPHEFHIETTTHVFDTGPRVNDFPSLKQTIHQYVTRLRQNNPDLFCISAASITSLILWQIPACHMFLQNHFICQRRNLLAGRLHVILTSSVSHMSFFHLLFSLMTLLSLGPQIQAATGWASLRPVLLGAAVTGSISSALLGHRDGASFGLSPVILALFGILARMYPARILSIRLMGIFPISMPSKMILQLFLIWSLLGSFMTRSSISHVSHLGGLIFGLTAYEVWLSSRHQGRPWQKDKLRYAMDISSRVVQRLLDW